MSYLPDDAEADELGNICQDSFGILFLPIPGVSDQLLILRFRMFVLHDVNGGSILSYIRLKKPQITSVFGDETYRSIAAERFKNLKEHEVSMV